VIVQWLAYALGVRLPTERTNLSVIDFQRYGGGSGRSRPVKNASMS